MKRYSYEARTEIENKKVDAFLQAVESVCVEHGFCIAHEDEGGAFMIKSPGKT